MFRFLCNQLAGNRRVACHLFPLRVNPSVVDQRAFVALRDPRILSYVTIPAL